MHTAYSTAAILSLALGASAQALNATYATGLLTALKTSNLNALATIATSLASNTNGQALLSRLATGKNTLLAPNDAAFANVSSTVTSNSTLLEAILSYHILSGAFTADTIATAPNHTLASSFLNTTGFVNLEGHASQVVALNYDNGTLGVRNQGVIKIVGNATYENIIIQIIDNVLDIPAAVPDELSRYGFSTLNAGLQANNLIPTLTSSAGLTILAPINSAFTTANATIGSLTPEQLTNLYKNHVILGKTIYTSQFGSGTTLTTAGGQAITLTNNATGMYATLGGTTAIIGLSDVLMNNGVFHALDRVLDDTNNDAGAASSAIASYSSVAATQAQPTQALGVTATAASTSSTATMTNGATRNRLSIDSAMAIGAVVAGMVLMA